jgi:quinol monooxygenase YgiN
MFGTVSRSRLKEGVTVDQLKELFAGEDGRPAGSVSLLVFQSSSDPRELWIASAFESREAYTKNADSPEQNARFERMRELMEGAPDWHDGEVIVARTDSRTPAST